jgi:hypothetical protein
MSPRPIVAARDLADLVLQADLPRRTDPSHKPT